jgi:hypothetical protein
LEFEWDKGKAETNFRAHGVSFQKAKTVFRDQDAVLVVDDRENCGEDRFILIGMAQDLMLPAVVYTERVTAIRIISARKVTTNEQSDYFSQFI